MTYAASRVRVRVGGATLLEDVSVSVAAGELVAMAGPNGAGKSTLIATLAGDRTPDEGAVTLAGRHLHAWHRGELARRRAVMGPERNVAFAFSVEEVVLLGRLPIHGGDPSEADRAIVRGLLEAVDCGHLGARVIGTLSTGERQRVALARALAQVTAMADGGDRGGLPGEPVHQAERYLLLDEPTSSLDPAHQHLAMRLLRRQVEIGRGVLAVLHDLNLAAAYADRIVLMSRARVVADGTPGEVLRPDVLEAVFGIPMLVLPHPHLAHPLVIAEPHAV